MRTRKQASLAVMSALVAVTMTACSGGNSTDSAKEGKSADGKTVVTLSVRQADPFLKLAEQKFEEVNPDIDIQLKEYTAASADGGAQLAMDELSFEKYLNTLNTEILSGKGADLISLQDLPYGKYVEKKALIDLNDMITKDQTFKSDEYLSNIWESAQVRNGVYAMPLGFSLHMMLGDSASLKDAGVKIDDKTWNWDSFAELTKKLLKDANGDGKPDKYIMTNTSPDSMLVDFLRDDYGKYVDQQKLESHFDSPEFQALLAQIKKMYDDNVFSEQSATWGEQFFSQWRANSVENLILYPKGVYDGNGKVYRKPLSRDDKGIAFSSSMMLGMNSKTKVKDEAWKFLKFLLSPEMQSSSELKAIPINKAAIDAQLNGIQDALKQGSVKLLTGFVPKPLTDEEVQAVHDVIGEAGAISKIDKKIVTIIFEESKAYFAGHKSGEETGKIIQNRVMTYLNE
ncbi:extracellular solute-binding protein [Paenibacillus sp. N1-5-1-14]|uniref:ABC transporter substrate-binding protein n=1 Tax=Paenibacillus radicibacter TaxID=2972488 RepID=UPI0021591C6E|nr:extracellular solute-binding protein [Paenibacillus radicibacter]MCR8644253.1 extracellular solute-binding protein [Paenibacillus radicibacter]